MSISVNQFVAFVCVCACACAVPVGGGDGQNEGWAWSVPNEGGANAVTVRHMKSPNIRI